MTRFMAKDALSRIDELVGTVDATMPLRAWIAKESDETTRWQMGMTNPAWMDKAVSNPEWAKQELQICANARTESAREMMNHLAPICEKLVRKDFEKNPEELNRIRFSLSREHDAIWEIGHNAAARAISRARGLAVDEEARLFHEYQYAKIDLYKDHSRER